MDEVRVRARVRPIHRVALGVLIAAATVLSGPAWSVDKPCPQTKASFSRAAGLWEIGHHLARREPVRILAIGSSSTQGVGASAPGQAYPSQLERLLEARWNSPDVTVENAGIGGETAVQTVARLEAALKASRPDLVIWQVGTNDAVRGGDAEGFRALLARGIAAAEEAGVEIILLDQQYYPAIKDPARYEAFVRAVRETADQHGVPVFSRYALMKAWADEAPETIAGMLAGDGFHMSDRGYACLTESLGGLIARRVQPSLAALPAQR